MSRDHSFIQLWRGWLIGIVVLFLLVPQLQAQIDTATMGGTVKDQSGAVVPSAKVTITNQGTSVARKTTTDAKGAYTMPLLPPGQYTLSVEKQGFKQYSRTGIVLQVDQTATVNATLTVGQTTQTVSVTAAPPLLERQTSSLGQVVTGSTIANLPLNGRQVFRLVQLTPGILSAPAASGQFHDIAVNTTFDTNFSINGGRTADNAIMIDGVPSTVGYYGGITNIPLPEATQEFKVQSSDLPAQYGRFSGGVVNVVTKSGTNQLHGRIFEFLRNDKFDATDFFTNKAGKTKPEFRMNQFGYAVGGPVIIPHVYNGHDRTFFFTDYQGTRWVQGTTFIGTMPTPAQRQGDFTQTFNNKGKLVKIYDPLSTQPDPNNPGQYIRTQFVASSDPSSPDYNPACGNAAGCPNIIPTARMDPVGLKLLSYYPQSNAPGAPYTDANNFISNAPRTIDKDQFDVRIDQNFSSANRLFGRYSQNITPLCQPDVYGNVATTGAGAVGCTYFHEHSATLGDTITLNPTTLLSLHYGFARWYHTRNTRSYGFDLSTLGFPSNYADGVRIRMFPCIRVTGYSNEACQSFTRQGFDTHTFMASVTKVTGNHNLTMGVDVQIHRINLLNVSNSAGTFSFTKGFTQGPNPNVASSAAGNAIASMLLGTVGSGSVPIGAGASMQDWYYAGYVQDDWKIKSNLTLNLGLRYDTETPYTERHNGLAGFDSTIPSPAANTEFPNLEGGLFYAGVNDHSRTVYNWNTKNFSPRFGFAYSPFSKTVVRGGFNLFYPPLEVDDAAIGFVPNPGYSSTTPMVGSINGGLTPFDYLQNPFPNGLVQPVMNTLGAATFLGQGISVLAHNVKPPYMEQWNFDIQQHLFSTILLDVGYSGSHGVHLTRVFDLNQLNPQYLSLGTDLQKLVPNPFAPFVTTGALAQPEVAQQQLLLPYPQFTGVQEINNTSASSNYNALQVKVVKRPSHGVNFLLAYTAGKLIIDTRSQQSVVGSGTFTQSAQNYYDLKGERALSEIDVAQSLVFSFVGNLPFGPSRKFLSGVHGLPAKLIGGWRVNGIFSARSGFPLGISTAISHGGNRPNSTGQNANLSTSRPDGQKVAEWFNTDAFTQPAPFTFGNVSRTLGNVRGPAFVNMDVSMIKNTHITERLGLEFRAEAFNVLNNPHFSEPNTNMQSGGFGTISSTVMPPRQIQFALKLTF